MKIITRLFQTFYWPICRAYSRHLGDRPADSFLRFLCAPQFWWTYRFWPNFLRPCRFSEKIWSRQLHERNPILTLVSDKFRVRDYIAGKVGHNCLVPLLWNGTDPAEIPFVELPSKFVIKVNHGCEYNVIVLDKLKIDYDSIRKQLRKWMAENFGQDTFLGIAWAYKNIKPHIIIESFIGERDKPPEDYKFFCFSGRMEFFKIDFSRFEDHSAKYYDRKLNSLDLVEVGFKEYQQKIDLPDNLWEMVNLAESISAGFDFIRVDLYSVANKIYFGELTSYPGGIFQRFHPEIYDSIFGGLWNWR